MSSSILHRRVPGLIAGCTLLVSSLLFSGCSILDKLFGDPEQYSHRPAMVLLVKSDDITSDGARVKINIDEIKVGNVSLSDLMGKATEWRVMIYTWSGGGPIVGDASYMPSTKREITLEKLPLDKLLRVDLDLKLSATTNGSDAKLATRSFGILLHEYPEKEMKK